MEFEQLLAPISDESPAGVDIREHPDYSGAFYELRDLRNSIRAQERKVIELEELYALASEWKGVQEQCLSILSEQSKDVEVLAWLAEAAVRLNGFHGLANVLVLMDKMIQTYWGQLYPLPDEDGINATLFPLTGLNGDNGEGTLVMPVRMAPLLTNSDGDAFSAWDFIKSCDLAQIQDEAKRQKRINNDGVKSLDQWQQMMVGIDALKIQSVAKAIQSCAQAFASLDQFLADQCGFDAPPTSAIKNVLSVALEALNSVTLMEISHLLEEPPEEAAESEEPEHSETIESDVRIEQMPSGPAKVANFRAEAYYPSSREEALVMVSRLRAFFRDTEPHSPLSYQMERIERWGRMSLGDLMSELLDDDATRSQFFIEFFEHFALVELNSAI
jgi:type VI secretion system protein ImpA